MAERYVVILDWAVDYESGIEVVGVAHNEDEAKKIFAECVKKERINARNNNFTIADDTEDYFDSGKDGYWAQNHITVSIKKKQSRYWL
jgi:hypothetical protein